MVIMQRHTWDNLLYRDTKTFEYKPSTRDLVQMGQ